MNISNLPEGLRQLAELRRRQDEPKVESIDVLKNAFKWRDTPEKFKFWSSVNSGDFSVYHGCKVTALKWKVPDVPQVISQKERDDTYQLSKQEPYH